MELVLILGRPRFSEFNSRRVVCLLNGTNCDFLGKTLHAILTEMGAPKKWIKTLLGLKKSDKLVSPEGKENSSRSTGKTWNKRKQSIGIKNSILENYLNRDVDTEFEDANLQSVWDPGSSPSTSLEMQNAAEHQWSKQEEWTAMDAKDANFQPASDTAGCPSTSLQVQSAAQLNMKEWVTVDAYFQSMLDQTSLPSTSLRVKNASQPKQKMGEECAAIDGKNANFQSSLHPTSPPYTLLHVQHRAQLPQNMSEEEAAIRIQKAFREFLLQNVVEPQQNMSEESAAICIQKALRGFLARRSFRGLKGQLRLQALVSGHAVKTQAAITLRCMQALVRVQARSRARHARMALENHAAQQKLQQQQEHEADVKKIEDGWQDGAGSAEEIQAKLLKRKEAAAKREKAKAYALARQWQARPKQQVTPVGFEPDKTNWGWNWLERWMAIRPWENHISGINLQEGMKILDNDSGHVPKTQISNTGKGKAGAHLITNTSISNGKGATYHSDGFSHSPNKSANASPTTRVPSRTSPKPVSSRSNLGSRSLSSPKERSSLPDKQGNKRLSLPGVAQGAQSGAKSSPPVPKPVNARNRSSNEKDVKSSKLR